MVLDYRRCKWCKRDILVKKNGVFKVHRMPRRISWDRARQLCPGSNQTPAPPMRDGGRLD